MIQRLSSSLSFAANKQNPVRDLYDAHINAISQTKNQPSVATNVSSAAPSLNYPIPMHGAGQKLDVVT